jgi:3-deoxy-manno-octulosonate cytidylyltransferase (CMP-KDO synthetase)
MSVLLVIPARYASTRYPGKPLVTLTGATGECKTLIERAWLAAQSVAGVDRIVVATDDRRIEQAAQGFGAEVVMTSTDCLNGTERCAETVEQLPVDYDIVVNLQGDAPLTPAWFIEDLINGLRADPAADIATPVLRCDGETLNALVQDRKAGRVGGTTAVFQAQGHALYFSKEVLPFITETYSKEAKTPVFHHVGVYAYRPPTLQAYPGWQIGPLETLEGLEQLRFLEQGRRVLCVEVEARSRLFWELNNPQDVARIEAMMLHMEMP